MNTFKREINGKSFTILCDYWGTRNSWGHEAALYVDSKKIKSYKIRYYNRTWERYTFQSVINACIYSALKELKEELKVIYKKEKGFKLLTEARKADFKEYLSLNADYKDLQALYNEF